MLQRPHPRDRHLQQSSGKMRRPRNKERKQRAGEVMTLALRLLKPLASHTECTLSLLEWRGTFYVLICSGLSRRDAPDAERVAHFRLTCTSHSGKRPEEFPELVVSCSSGNPSSSSGLTRRNAGITSRNGS
jgi:hypothetical protein